MSDDIAVSTNLAPVTNDIVASGENEDGEWSIEVVDVGVLFNGTIPKDVWDNWTENLLRVEGWTPWGVADSIIYGENTYGETYAQAVYVTGYKANTIAKWVWTARQIPHEMRRMDLDFTYHTLVAPKRIPAEAKQAYLERAAAGEFTSSEMNKVIKREMFPEEQEVVERLTCPFCGDTEGWLLRDLHRAECKCGAHGEELLDLIYETNHAISERWADG